MKSIIGIIILFLGISGLLNYAPSSDASGWVVAFLWILCFFGLDIALSGLTE